MLCFRLPNVTVGVLTRDSIRTALRSGITADQIVGFLRMHAHPKMKRPGTPVLPPTVVDQIYLWEQERNRFTFSEGVLYSQFMSQSDFDTLRDYAQDLGVLVWQNDRKRTMVCKLNFFYYSCGKIEILFLHFSRVIFSPSVEEDRILSLGIIIYDEGTTL